MAHPVSSSTLLRRPFRILTATALFGVALVSLILTTRGEIGNGAFLCAVVGSLCIAILPLVPRRAVWPTVFATGLWLFLAGFLSDNFIPIVLLPGWAIIACALRFPLRQVQPKVAHTPRELTSQNTLATSGSLALTLSEAAIASHNLEALLTEVPPALWNGISALIDSAQTTQAVQTAILPIGDHCFSLRLVPLATGYALHIHDVTTLYNALDQQKHTNAALRLSQEILLRFREGALEAVPSILERYATYTGAEHVYLMAFAENLPSGTFEWSRHETALTQILSMSVDDLVINHAQTIFTADSPLSPPLEALFQKFSLKSLLVLPFTLGTDGHGYIAVGHKATAHVWSNDEMDLLTRIVEHYQHIVLRQQATSDAIQARDSALHMLQFKNEFLATMSHELRTPMTGILGMLELLEETNLRGEQAEFVEAALTSSHRLMTVLNDILDFTKIETNKIIVEARATDIRALLSDIRQRVAPSVAQKKLTLSFEIAEDVPSRIWCDPERVKQILEHLLNNAIKFTERGRVTLRVKRESEINGRIKIGFEVIDTGIGISPEQQQRIFESFTQADRSLTRRYQGAGLGLTLANHLVTLMGGLITVESSLQRGSKFSFSLVFPIAAVDNEPDRALEVANLKVMVIDSDETIRKPLIEQLRAWKVDVLVPSQISDAMSVLMTRQPVDVVLVFATDFSAYQFAQKVRSQFKERSPRLVRMVTERNQGGSNVFDRELRRPVRQAELYEALIRVADRRADAESSILLVEDNLDNQILIQRTLTRMDYRVDVAIDGQEALPLIERNTYNLILMDINMPRLDGIATTKRIRGSGGPNRNAPIVLITADAHVADRDRCLSEGANAVLYKPFSLVSLREVIAQWIRPSASAQSASKVGKNA
jgi:signal transduction histidine kinase/CheY-like chemotaxis protein